MKSLYPEDYSRVLSIDDQIGKVNENIFLHRSMRRMREIIWRCDVDGALAFIPPVPCEICQ
jgi:hypothetical protein